jgi:hypothetical protein
MNKLIFLLAFIYFPHVSLASDIELNNCKKVASQIQTPIGILQRYTCPSLPTQPKWLANWQTKWGLGKMILLSGTGDISSEVENNEHTLLAFTDFTDPNLGCPARMFLIDLSSDKPRVYAFGVKNACAEYHWASWGKNTV